MRIFATLLAVAAAAIPAVLGQADDTPELKVTTTFPNNPLSLVKNGQANRVVFSIQNPPSAERVLSLVGITGAWLDPAKADGQRGRVLRNMTTASYKSLSLRTVGGKPLEVPFDFYPEFRPQTLGVEFRMHLVDGQTGKKHNVPAYAGSVTVIEPPKNWLDPQLWTIYLFALAILGAVGYYAKKTFLPAPAKAKGGKSAVKGSINATASASAPGFAPSSASGSATAAKGTYDAEWIPDHHLRPRASRTRSGDISSGDEGRKSPSGKKRGSRK